MVNRAFWGAILAAVLATGPASAQLQLPGAAPSTPAGTTMPPATGPGPGPDSVRPPRPAAPPPPPAQRSEETLPGRTLRFLGTQGSLLINRVGTGPRATFTAVMTGVGRRGNDIRNICTPSFNGGQPVALRAVGRPRGMPRYEAEFPGCRIVMDWLGDSVIVSAPDGVCNFTDECAVDPAGLWGPGDRDMPAEAIIERARGAADRRVNEARQRLTSQLRNTPEWRPFLQEQAAFPAERERHCRNYGTNDAGLGFCALRYTEARAFELEARIAGTASATPEQPRR